MKKNKEIECKFCYKKFKPTKKQICCSKECDTKYCNYLVQDNVENPWDKYIKN
jgi:hypothetical protein